MKRLPILLIAFALSACAVRAPIQKVPEKQNLDGVMEVFGRFAFGHACPCDGLVLTAAHVASPLYSIPGLRFAPIGYSWSDHRGGKGYLISEFLFVTRDLAVMNVITGIPAYYRHAKEAPEIGETLHWVEFDFRTLQNAFAPREREAKLLRDVAGHLVLDEMPTGGGSGSCVVNDRGEVVATAAFSHRIGASIIVSVYGDWWPGEMK